MNVPPIPPIPPIPQVPLVHVDGVTVTLGGKVVLADISLDIMRREHTALTGANGAGKSTLLRLLQGEVRPDQRKDGAAGSVLWSFNGTQEPYVTAAREHVRLVSPSGHHGVSRRGLPMNGRGLILSGLENAPMLYGEATPEEAVLADALAAEAGLSRLLDMPVPAMSQGQLRAMLLLRALTAEPDLLLLDEPFDGLDRATKRRINDILLLAADRGGTVVITGHRLEDIPDFIRRVVHIRTGRVERSSVEHTYPFEKALLRGIPEQALRKRTVPAATTGDAGDKTLNGGWSDIGALNDVALPDNSADERRAFAYGLPAFPLSRSTENDVPVLQLEHVDVFIERRQVLFDINWTIHSGEQWIVTGANGSGKSTLLRLLYGEEFAAWTGPERTQVRWFGEPRPALDVLHGFIGYVSDRLQENYLHDLPVRDIIVSGLRGSIGLYEPATEAEAAEADRWIERMDLYEVRNRSFLTLSNGWARRVLLARALASAPPVLLLDEPCSGLDAESRRLFLNALPVLAAAGVQIVHVSHHTADDTSLFTHELRLEAGRAIFAGPRVC